MQTFGRVSGAGCRVVRFLRSPTRVSKFGGRRVAGVWSSGSSIRGLEFDWVLVRVWFGSDLGEGAAARFVRTTDSKVHLVCVWLVRDEEPGSRSCPSGFRVEIMFGNFT
ncbi:hypothetical protein Droror1_Dr00025674, partial [Drosera rotundifolia]